MEAYNKLVNPSLLGDLHSVLVDDHHPAFASNEDYTVDLFVDAPSESCTDPSPSCLIGDDETLTNPEDVEHLLPDTGVNLPSPSVVVGGDEKSLKSDEECRQSPARTMDDDDDDAGTSDVAAVF